MQTPPADASNRARSSSGERAPPPPPPRPPQNTSALSKFLNPFLALREALRRRLSRLRANSDPGKQPSDRRIASKKSGQARSSARKLTSRMATEGRDREWLLYNTGCLNVWYSSTDNLGGNEWINDATGETVKRKPKSAIIINPSIPKDKEALDKRTAYLASKNKDAKVYYNFEARQLLMLSENASIQQARESASFLGARQLETATIETIDDLLGLVGLPQWSQRFKEEGLDLATSFFLREEDLTELGFVIGERIRFMQVMKCMRKVPTAHIQVTESARRTKFIKGDIVERVKQQYDEEGNPSDTYLVQKGKIVGVHDDDPAGMYYTVLINDNEPQCGEEKLAFPGFWEKDLRAKGFKVIFAREGEVNIPVEEDGLADDAALAAAAVAGGAAVAAGAAVFASHNSEESNNPFDGLGEEDGEEQAEADENADENAQEDGEEAQNEDDENEFDEDDEGEQQQDEEEEEEEDEEDDAQGFSGREPPPPLPSSAVSASEQGDDNTAAIAAAGAAAGAAALIGGAVLLASREDDEDEEEEKEGDNEEKEGGEEEPEEGAEEQEAATEEQDVDRRVSVISEAPMLEEADEEQEPAVDDDDEEEEEPESGLGEAPPALPEKRNSTVSAISEVPMEEEDEAMEEVNEDVVSDGKRPSTVSAISEVPMEEAAVEEAAEDQEFEEDEEPADSGLGQPPPSPPTHRPSTVSAISEVPVMEEDAFEPDDNEEFEDDDEEEVAASSGLGQAPPPLPVEKRHSIISETPMEEQNEDVLDMDYDDDEEEAEEPSSSGQGAPPGRPSVISTTEFDEEETPLQTMEDVDEEIASRPSNRKTSTISAPSLVSEEEVVDGIDIEEHMDDLGGFEPEMLQDDIILDDDDDDEEEAAAKPKPGPPNMALKRKYSGPEA